jgi:hypothetical protein
MVVHDGAILVETALYILRSRWNTPEQIFKEKHIEGLRKESAGDVGTWVGRQVGMDNKNAKEAAGSLGSDETLKKLLENSVL